MKSRLLIVSVLVALAALGTPTLAAAGHPETTTWHRVNPDQSHAAPEHERWQCRTAAVWVCHYDKVQERALNFRWDRAAATFIGRDITDTWDCPEFFETRCGAVRQVVAGTSHIRPDGGPAQRYQVEFVVLRTSVLYVVVDVPTDEGAFTFACPWYPSFGGALHANPFPLPFNGSDWPAPDCISPPEDT